MARQIFLRAAHVEDKEATIRLRPESGEFGQGAAFNRGAAGEFGGGGAGPGQGVGLRRWDRAGLAMR